MDWSGLWRELAELQARRWAAKSQEQGRGDPWQGKAHSFDAHVRQRWARPDSNDAFLLDLLRRRLAWQDGRYLWPPGVRTALVYWDVKS